MLVILLANLRNDNRTRVSFVTLASSYSHFCRNSREPPQKEVGVCVYVCVCVGGGGGGSGNSV